MLKLRIINQLHIQVTNNREFPMDAQTAGNLAMFFKLDNDSSTRSQEYE